MNHTVVSQEGNSITFRLDGEIDKSNDFEFLEPCLAKKMSVSVDLAGVTYINSCGFGAMVDEAISFREANAKLEFFNLDPCIRETINMLGAEQLLNFRD